MTIKEATEVLLEVYKVKAVRHNKEHKTLIVTYLDDQMNHMTVEIVLPNVSQNNIKLRVNSRCLILFAYEVRAPARIDYLACKQG